MASKNVGIPQITEEFLSVEMVQPTGLTDLGPGGETFKIALRSWNLGNHDDARRLYEQALREGLTNLAKGASHANLGQIKLKQGQFREAIQDFLAILQLKQATYDSVNDAAQYLSVMLAELGRLDEAHKLEALAAKAQVRLGYSLREDAKDAVRRMIRLRSLD